jgi:hypothetical protein
MRAPRASLQGSPRPSQLLVQSKSTGRFIVRPSVEANVAANASQKGSYRKRATMSRPRDWLDSAGSNSATTPSAGSLQALSIRFARSVRTSPIGPLLRRRKPVTTHAERPRKCVVFSATSPRLLCGGCTNFCFKASGELNQGSNFHGEHEGRGFQRPAGTTSSALRARRFSSSLRVVAFCPH